MERVVARAWQQALGIPAVGLTDNFFDLGAHSLTVAEAHAKLQEALGREIALARSLSIHDGQRTGRASRRAIRSAAQAAASQLSERAARRRMARQREATAP